MRKTLCFAVIVALLAIVAPLLAASQEPTQESLRSQREQRLEQLKASAPQELTEAFKRNEKNFEDQYPAIVGAIREDKFSFIEMDVMWRVSLGTIGNSTKVHIMMCLFEAGRIELGELKESAASTAQSTVRTESEPDSPVNCSDCSFISEMYYRGCRDGGGDSMSCFFAAEQLRCICETDPACGYRLDCQL